MKFLSIYVPNKFLFQHIFKTKRHYGVMKNYFSIRPGKYNLERFYLVNRSRGRDRLSELDGEVSEVTSLLKDNVDKVLTRGDKLDDIQQKAGTSNISLNVVFFSWTPAKLFSICSNYNTYIWFTYLPVIFRFVTCNLS